MAVRSISTSMRLQISRFRYSKRLCHQLATVEVEEAKYPPIIDASPEGKKRHERQLLYDRIKELPTVEQKLYEITANRSYFLKTYLLSPCPASYLGVPFNFYITRTHVIQDLPERIQSMNVDTDYEILKPELCLAVTKHFTNLWRDSRLSGVSEFLNEKECGSKLINELTVNIFRSLAWKNTHLLTAAFDPRIRLDSYWWHGGFASKKDVLDQKNICFQFTDCPYFTIRIDKPLPSIVQMNDPLCATGEVEDYNYHPRHFGNPFSCRHYITVVPGFWPGDPCDLPLLQFHTMDKLEMLTKKIEYFDMGSVENAYGVMAAFGWLNALATYQGFTPYHDLTYPLVGQVILTNGQDWCFFVYQLNTIAFHSDLDKKDRRNLCWSSGRMRLFETVENGEIKGLNDEVFKTLLKFVLHAPKEMDKKLLKPYLGEETRTEEEITTMRTELRKMFRNTRNIKAHLWEVPLWQHVYKRHPDAPPCPWIKLK